MELRVEGWRGQVLGGDWRCGWAATAQPVGLKLHGHTHERRRVNARYRSTCRYSAKRIEVVWNPLAAIEGL